mmetsp:Transcript_22684/g.32008  ORF Transcript_22684/g.32008 Transcript_22684/m.32008 type:complete len:759 (-) Transcript_22684:100-2376(-)
MPRSQGTSRKGKPKKGERASGMGRALERAHQKRFRPKSNGSSRGAGMAAAPGTQSIGVNEKDAENKKMLSVLEVDNLSDFLAQAEMANRDFISEREQFVVLDSVGAEYKHGFEDKNQDGTVRWADQEEEKRIEQEKINRAYRDNFGFRELNVPRRPKWDKSTTAEELDKMEKDSFLEWRRSIAEMEEKVMSISKHTNTNLGGNGGAVTPFEKNIEVWRQLWRVLERSQLVVQIVDARNPSFYLSSDLRTYAEKELGKPMLVVVNKSDYLSESQRGIWHKHFIEIGVKHLFFSAHSEQEKLDQSAKAERIEFERFDEDQSHLKEDNYHDNFYVDKEKESEVVEVEAVKSGVKSPLTREQLLTALKSFASEHSITPETCYGNRIQFGMVGFPNVGKSSVINVLVGASKHSHDVARVGVASQPGKTKHFQTLLIPDDSDIMLCDCPGLVFPSFVSSAADLIAAGVYPIAQMRDHWPVVELICHRIPREVLDAHFSITLPRPTIQDIKEANHINELSQSKQPSILEIKESTFTKLPPPTAEELLRIYCIARSILSARSGEPDYQRAARIVIKDYVEGKLLYCHPPPGLANEEDYARETLFMSISRTKRLREKLSNILNLTENTKSSDEEKNTEYNSIDKDFRESGSSNERIETLQENNFEDDIDILDLVDGVAIEQLDNNSNCNQNQGKKGKKHKSMQKWGKKGRKTRNPDPYGCHSTPEVDTDNKLGPLGVRVNAGKYGRGSYTRPDYTGARAAVAFSNYK